MPYAMVNNANVNSTYNLYVNPHGKKQLSPTFTPGPYDVICARGKAAYEHEGNKRFRAIVKMHKEGYSNALTKYHKSQIVSHITNAIRQASPEGGFVKLINGCYWEVGDRTAKEKIGQTFRDLLDSQYSSSTKAKARARIQRRVETYRSESPKPQQTESMNIKQEQQQQQTDNFSSSVSVVSQDSVSENKENNTMMSMPSHIDIITSSSVPKSQEPSLFDTFNQLLESEAPGVSSNDLEPLPLDFQPAEPIVSDSEYFSGDEELLDEWQDICEFMGFSF